MAIYHLCVKNISRAEGRSAVAASAYRSGTRLRNEAENRVSDFSGRSGVVHSEMVLPADAPGWAADRDTFWNALEAVESRKDARLAKEVEIALPKELAAEANVALARRFTCELFAAAGIVADLSVHDEGDGNPHAHILLATRSLAPDGFGGKDRRLDDRAFLSDARERWEVYANEALTEHGVPARIDRRTLEAQGIDRVPHEHRGPARRDDPAEIPPPMPKIGVATGGDGYGGANPAADDEAEALSDADAGGGPDGLAEQLDAVERRLAGYLHRTAGERERARRRAQAIEQLNAYQLRIQRQEAYLQNLRAHQQRVQAQQHRCAGLLFGTFSSVYRNPDRAYSNIWHYLFGPSQGILASLFKSKKPSLFGELQGWSFLFFESPKRRRAKRTARTVPDQLTEYLKVDTKANEVAARLQEVEHHLSLSRDRTASLYQAIAAEPPAQLDAEQDRDIRVRLFQERNAVLARLSAHDIAISDLPDERKAALIAIAARYRERQEALDRGGRGGR